MKHIAEELKRIFEGRPPMTTAAAAQFHRDHMARLARMGMPFGAPVVRARALALPAPSAILANAISRQIEKPKPPMPGKVYRCGKCGFIIAAVAAHFGVTVEEILSPSRLRRFVVPRKVAMWVLAVTNPSLSLPWIGRQFSRDHTTVLHAIRTTERCRDDLAASLKAIGETLCIDLLTVKRRAERPRSPRRAKPHLTLVQGGAEA